MGFRPIVIDTGDDRKQLATSLGAEAFIDFKTSSDVTAEVIKLTGGIGAHGVFVTASQSYGNALSYLGTRVSGVVMCIALPAAGTHNVSKAFDPLETQANEYDQITVVPASLVFRNQSVKGTLVSSMADVEETLEFAKRGKLRLQPTVVGLSKWNEACQALKNGKVVGRMVVDFNKE